MSSKLRLEEIAFDDDNFDHEFELASAAPASRKKANKSKRKKQDSGNYLAERSLKRGALESCEFR